MTGHHWRHMLLHDTRHLGTDSCGWKPLSRPPSHHRVWLLGEFKCCLHKGPNEHCWLHSTTSQVGQHWFLTRFPSLLTRVPISHYQMLFHIIGDESCFWKLIYSRHGAYFPISKLTLSLLSSKSTLKRKCINEVARICIIIIFQLSKLWKAKFSLLCDVIFLVGLEGKFDIYHSGLTFMPNLNSVLALITIF